MRPIIIIINFFTGELEAHNVFAHGTECRGCNALGSFPLPLSRSKPVHNVADFAEPTSGSATRVKSGLIAFSQAKGGTP